MLLLKTLQASKIVKRRRWFDGDAKRLWREWLWLKIKSLERNPASAKQEWNRRFGAIQSSISFQEQNTMKLITLIGGIANMLEVTTKPMFQRINVYD